MGVSANSKMSIAAEATGVVAALTAKLVVIEGNIASGKSTLCADIQKRLNGDSGELVEVCRETTDDMFLKHFYQDPAHFAFSFQAYMLKTRLFQMMGAVRMAQEEDKLVLMDRGAGGDTCFAKLNWLHGKMDQEQWELYQKLCSSKSFTESNEQAVDCMVYLDVEPASCQHRVRNMRQTESEQLIPLDYFHGIDDMYFDLLMKVLDSQKENQTKVMVMRWDEFGSTQNMLARVSQVVAGERTCPRVFMGSEGNSEEYPSCTYDSDDDISQMYDWMCSESGSVSATADEDDAVGQPSGFVTLKWDLCHVDKPNFTVESATPFHSNAYKRVVMYHLSKGEDVHFIL